MFYPGKGVTSFSHRFHSVPTHTHPPPLRISHAPHRRNTPLHTIPLNRHPTRHMHAHRSHRHVQSLSSQTTTPHHSRDSTACAPLLTRAPLVSTPLHAISRIYTAVLNTHIHTHTHTPTKSTCLHTIPLCKRTTLHIHNSHMHRNTVHYTHIPQTPRHTHPHNTVFAPHYSHTHHHTKLVCTYIHPFHVRAQTLHMQPSLHISTSTHIRSTIYTPHIHTHTPHYTHAHKPTSAHTQALPLLILKC